jgi:DNA-binding response OmpR family regulator
VSKKCNILLVEDDPNFGLVLCDYLKMNNYNVDLATNGKIGYNLFRNNAYDLCILDVMMPEMDGFTLAQEMVNHGSDTPFFFLTAKSLKEDVIQGYKLGAKDFLHKPFDPEILILKIKAILDTKVEEQLPVEDSYTFLNYSLDVNMRKLEGNNISTQLSPRECQLLAYLLQNKNQLVKRDQVLDNIWKENTYFTARSMDVYINKLRKHFKADHRITLENLRGEGFVFALKGELAAP